MASEIRSEDPWRRFRRHRRRLFGGWLGFMPYVTLVALAARALHTERAAPWFVVPYAVAWVINGAMLSLFRCPRCRRAFCRRGLAYGNPWTLTCLHCGQRAYRPIAPGPVKTVPFRFW